MRYLALAADYDNTLALHGRMSAVTALAIDRLRMSGRRVVLVTGRRLGDFLTICPNVRQFDFVIAENGAVVFDPAVHEEVRLANPPPERFVQRLRERRVEPLDVGRVVVAPPLLATVNLVIAVGRAPAETPGAFSAAAGRPLPEARQLRARPDHVMAWLVGDGSPPFPMRFVTSRAERIRHHRKCAEGNIRYHSQYHSFYWR